MITDLIQIRRMGDKKREENLRFRKYLKSHQWVERRFRQAAKEATDQMDCRACGECCRVSEVAISERDIDHLIRFLGIGKADFIAQYTMTGVGGEMILKRTKAGCVFLDGNDCSVYEARPANCERFPNLLRGAGSIPSRMWEFVDRATYCPIVYEWMEVVKGLTKFR